MCNTSDGDQKRTQQILKSKNANRGADPGPGGGSVRLLAAAASAPSLGRLGVVLVGLLEGGCAVRPVVGRVPVKDEDTARYFAYETWAYETRPWRGGEAESRDGIELKHERPRMNPNDENK